MFVRDGIVSGERTKLSHVRLPIGRHELDGFVVIGICCASSGLVLACDKEDSVPLAVEMTWIPYTGPYRRHPVADAVGESFRIFGTDPRLVAIGDSDSIGHGVYGVGITAIENRTVAEALGCVQRNIEWGYDAARAMIVCQVAGRIV